MQKQSATISRIRCLGAAHNEMPTNRPSNKPQSRPGQDAALEEWTEGQLEAALERLKEIHLNVISRPDAHMAMSYIVG